MISVPGPMPGAEKSALSNLNVCFTVEGVSLIGSGLPWIFLSLFWSNMYTVTSTSLLLTFSKVTIASLSSLSL